MFEKVKASEVPEPPRKQSAFASELIAAVASLGKDEVLKMVPPEGKSIRGVKTGIGRVAGREGLTLETWDDGETIFIRKK